MMQPMDRREGVPGAARPLEPSVRAGEPVKKGMRLADKISIWAFLIVMAGLVAMMMYGHNPP